MEKKKYKKKKKKEEDLKKKDTSGFSGSSLRCEASFDRDNASIAIGKSALEDIVLSEQPVVCIYIFW